MKESLAKRLFELIPQLNALQEQKRVAEGNHEVNKQEFHFKEKKKYVNIDLLYVTSTTSGSGVWMVDKDTNEVFNINGYGVPNKKKNLGNIHEITAEFLFSKRWNYLR